MARPDWIDQQVLRGDISVVFALELIELITGRKRTIQDVKDLQELRRITRDRKRLTTGHGQAVPVA